MPTYFIRSHETGEIVNAVECGDMTAALLVCDRMAEDVYPQQFPPVEVLERYYYWSHRP
jgi:hypothetical protein